MNTSPAERNGKGGNRAVELSQSGFGVRGRERLVIGTTGLTQERLFGLGVIPPIRETALGRVGLLAGYGERLLRRGIPRVSDDQDLAVPEFSTHEQRYGFEHPPYRKYMSYKVTDGVSPSHLLGLSAAMARDAAVHPLVESAAGWSAVSAALHRSLHSDRPDHRISPNERSTALYAAEGLWTRARDRLRELRLTTVHFSPDLAANLLGHEIRVSQGLAYLPDLHLAADVFGGAQVSDGDIAKRNACYKNEFALLLARNVMDISGRHQEFIDTKLGMYGEILAGVIPLMDPERRILMLPTTVQQDHNLDPHRRADLRAVSMTEPGHPSGLVQVTSLREEPENRYRMNIRTHGGELTLDDRHSPFATLKTIIALQNGESIGRDNERKLSGITERLTDRLLSFVRKRDMALHKIS